MAKRTLLSMVQNILSAMDSDEVNSISDTVESLQVAEIVRETYEDLVATLEIPERQALLQLESVSDTTRPNYLRIPDKVRRVEWIRYRGNLINYLTPDEFIRLVSQNTKGTNTKDFNGISYLVTNNKDPKWWTTFNDHYIAFDSYNASTESTLEEINTMCFGSLNYDFVMDDTFIPHLDENMFPLLLSEAKAACFINLKQVSNSKEEQRARRSLTRVQNELSRTSRGNPADRLPDYGRRR